MTVIWIGWVLTIIISFAVFETYAVKTGTQSLSQFVWQLSRAFPPFPLIVGLIFGFLFCHFWWGGIVPFSILG